MANAVFEFVALKTIICLQSFLSKHWSTTKRTNSTSVACFPFLLPLILHM